MSVLKKFILGTRGSKLAVVQSQWVADQIMQCSSVEVELKIIKTRGDRILDKPMAEIGGKGLFTLELEQALKTGDIDFAVHSLKDLPQEDPDELSVSVIPKRADPRDALIGMPNPKIIGTGSKRRMSQLKSLYSEAQAQGIRGNIDTRLRKLDDGAYDAIVLAMAGLIRADMMRQDVMPFSVSEMVPAAGQGALAVQHRSHDLEVLKHLKLIHDVDTYEAVSAEREVLSHLGGGCHAPIGVHMCRNGGVFEGYLYDGASMSQFTHDSYGEIVKLMLDRS